MPIPFITTVIVILLIIISFLTSLSPTSVLFFDACVGFELLEVFALLGALAVTVSFSFSVAFVVFLLPVLLFVEDTEVCF